MGRRKNRKLERKQRQKSGDSWGGYAEPALVDPETLAFSGGGRDDYDAFTLFEQPWRLQAATKSCGNCREFIEDQEGGRGSCLHPGSGISFPWTDTAACDFFARRR